MTLPTEDKTINLANSIPLYFYFVNEHHKKRNVAPNKEENKSRLTFIVYPIRLHHFNIR